MFLLHKNLTFFSQKVKGVGVKMTKKKQNCIVKNETVGLVYRYWEC